MRACRDSSLREIVIFTALYNKLSIQVLKSLTFSSVESQLVRLAAVCPAGDLVTLPRLWDLSN